MKQAEVFADTWSDKKDEWLEYVKNDVLGAASSYARYSNAMEDITGFGMKDCLSLPGLRSKYFNSLRTEQQLIYNYKDKFLR